MTSVWQIYAPGDLLAKQYARTLEEFDESNTIDAALKLASKKWDSKFMNSKDSWWTLLNSVQSQIQKWVKDGQGRFEFMHSAETDEDDEKYIKNNERDGGILGIRRLGKQDFMTIEFQGAFCRIGVDMNPSFKENGAILGTVWSDRRCGETALVHCPMRQISTFDASNVVHPVFVQ
jgi:hypothetical protein